MRTEIFKALLRRVTENDENFNLLELTAKAGDDDVLDTQQIRELAEALKINSKISALHIIGMKIGDNGVKYLVEMLQLNTSIISIQLVDVGITKVGFSAICRGLVFNQHIILLDLHSNQLEGSFPPVNDNECSTDAGDALQFLLNNNRKLQHLDIANCHLGDMAFHLMAEGMQNNTILLKLNISGNYITHIGLSPICSQLKKNSTLLELEGIDKCMGSTYNARLETDLIKEIQLRLVWNKKIASLTVARRDTADYAAYAMNYLASAATSIYTFAGTLFTSQSGLDHADAPSPANSARPE